VTPRVAAHTCHAMDCNVAVPPRMFMCRRHWFMLPKTMRDAVWSAYVPGQENRKDPTDRYLHIAMTAVRWLAEKEGRIVHQP
jgi:hypothetical protein